MPPEQKKWKKENVEYFAEELAKMQACEEEMKVWLLRECMGQERQIDFRLMIQKFTWGSLTMCVLAEHKGRDTTMLRFPLTEDSVRVYFLTPKELNLLADIAGKFGDAFGYQMRSDDFWTDRMTHLCFTFKPKFDHTRTGIQ